MSLNEEILACIVTTLRDFQQAVQTKLAEQGNLMLEVTQGISEEVRKLEDALHTLERQHQMTLAAVQSATAIRIQTKDALMDAASKLAEAFK